MPVLGDNAALARRVREQSRDQFLADWSGFYLLCAPSDEPRRQFITEPAEPSPANLKTPTRTRFEVQRLVKSGSHPNADRISVGRARNCDVVLRHPTVSKLHAHFRLEGERLALIAASTRNGTTVNDEVLIPERRVAVDPGDRIRFGLLETNLYDAAALYEFLR